MSAYDNIQAASRAFKIQAFHLAAEMTMFCLDNGLSLKGGS